MSRCRATFRARLYTDRKVTHECRKPRGHHGRDHVCHVGCGTMWKSKGVLK